MNDTKSNIVGIIVFFLLILILGVGGYFLTVYLTNEKKEKNNNTVEIVLNDEHKADKSKDYIYFANEKFISMEPDITYEDVVINLNTAETINQTLKKELDVIRSSVKYISDNELDPNRTIMYDGENIYSAGERNYETYNYKEYISLIVKDYEFNCYDGSLLKNLKSYVFNILTGKLQLSNELLELYDITMDEIKNKARAELEKSQTIIEETELELILIEDTLNNLNENNYALFIDNYGDLYISFVVKTTQVDYNESIKLN